MALLHRDRTDDARETADDTVVGPAAGTRPAWPAPSATTPAPAERVVHRNSIGHTLRTMLATLLLVAIAAFAVANTDRVGVDLLVEEYETSLAVLVGVSAAAGALLGLLLGWRRPLSRQ
jgi:uncharacterized integral membrane protein